MYLAKNRLLNAIPEVSYPELFKNLEIVNLNFQQIIYYSGQPIDHIYFPLESVISLSSGTDTHEKKSEIALLGNEGIVGLSVFLGSPCSDIQASVSIPGLAGRLDKQTFQVESQRPGILREQMFNYTLVRLNNISQNVACKAHHTIQQQLARWLLSLYDRIEGNEFQLTQPFIAELFGVRRASITDAAVKLHKAGVISYRRGKIIIIDPSGLEAIACSCYNTVKSFFNGSRTAKSISRILKKTSTTSR